MLLQIYLSNRCCPVLQTRRDSVCFVNNTKYSHFCILNSDKSVLTSDSYSRMNGYPQMTSLSDVVALKRRDMEGIERRRRYFIPMTPKVVPWNINTERPNTYFPNICEAAELEMTTNYYISRSRQEELLWQCCFAPNRTFTTDLTYIPGTAQRKRFHPNVVNREATWSPYEPKKLNLFRNIKELPLEGGDETEEEETTHEQPTIADAMRHPEIRISKPLGMLRREYKHPLSMYEDALSNLYSRYLKQRPKSWDPILPLHYDQSPSQPFSPVVYVERPGTAGKPWVTNRWRMWSGGSASSPTS